MSATFSFETFSKYFENCKVFQVQGSLFPVEEKYLEDAIEETQFYKFPEPRYSTKNKRSREDKFSSEFDGLIAPYARNLRGYSRRTTEAIMNPESEKINIELIEKLIFHISETKDQGGILVFLPGYGTISDLLQALTKNPRYNSSRFWILPLHSMMQSSEQKRVFDPAPNNVRKVCTDYDIERNCQTLEEQFTTLSNSRQRRGRAGRVRPGICYHLYTRAREMVLDNFPTPEIQRSRLEGVILNFKVLHLNNVEEIFKEMIDKPNEQTVLNGLTLDHLMVANVVGGGVEEQFTTLSNSRQRRGRAGRVRPGICYHLYTRAREMVLDKFPTPEIQRSRLEGVILNFKVLHLNNVEEIFKEMIDKPNEQTVLNGLTLLKRIEALDENETLTPLGLHLAHLPVDPQMGKMLLLGALF
uniref:Helicase associated domain-containing protein n=1 Tax=Megaselia scalaris TaxID=36166 RepID=T1H4P7_MEGSC